MHHVIALEDDYWVHDFTRGYDEDFVCPYRHSIGRYDEIRPGMYTHEIFEGKRDLHIGIDIGAPVGEEIHAFSNCVVHSKGINSEDGSYGPTIITKHDFEGKDLWALHGHLSLESLDHVEVGQDIEEGDVIAFVGSMEVNGGWEPHLHLQLSWCEPEGNDMPGVVERIDRESALKIYPDPRIVLGPIY
jgi:murein DD-endopeptidase MepM/ murein hydrolase activator NlpD